MEEEDPLLFQVLIYLPFIQRYIMINYTKIHHDKLLNVLNESTDFCFKVGDGESISIDGYGAKWTNQRRSGVVAFTKSTLKRAVKFLL